jgi:hypothetical protein
VSYAFFRHYHLHLQDNNQASLHQLLCLTLLPFVSPPSESWPQTLRDFPPSLLQSSSQPAIVFRISDCSAGQFSFRWWKPSDLITAACEIRNNMLSTRKINKHNSGRNHRFRPQFQKLQLLGIRFKNEIFTELYRIMCKKKKNQKVCIKAKKNNPSNLKRTSGVRMPSQK